MVQADNGRCSAAPSLQLLALKAYLHNILGATTKRKAGSAKLTDSINVMLDGLLQLVADLGKLVPRGSNKSTISDAGIPPAAGGYIDLEATKLGGDNVEYITAVYAKHAALDLADFTKLTRALPELLSLVCEACNRTGASGQRYLALLVSLPADARHMTKLSLPSCKLTGQLPADWCSWSSLKTLSLGQNSLAGKLPAQYGDPNVPTCDPFMNRELVMSLADNNGLVETVPTAYSWFSRAAGAQLDVRGSGISGCCLDGLSMLPQLPVCGSQGNDSSSSVLKALKQVLQSNAGQSAALEEWDIGNAVNKLLRLRLDARVHKQCIDCYAQRTNSRVYFCKGALSSSMCVQLAWISTSRGFLNCIRQYSRAATTL
jgi:hypothetical protein